MMFLPPACFPYDILIKVKESDEIIEKKNENIKRDDFVLTLDNSRKQIFSKIINNLK